MESSVILIADRAWREDNGKVGLAGIFSVINIPNFPAGVQPFYAFLRLLDMPAGHYDVVFNVISDGNHAVLSSVTAGIDLAEFQESIDLPVPIAPFVVQGPGNLSIHVSVNGLQVERFILQVRAI